MAEFQKWVNGGRYDGGRLSPEQKNLRDWYRRLLWLVREPGFARGEFYGLNFANRDNSTFGRVDGETVSGHWIYAFLRRDAETGQAFLVVANFHPQTHFDGLRVEVPEHAWNWLGIPAGKAALKERLADEWTGATADGSVLLGLEALSARVLELMPVAEL